MMHLMLMKEKVERRCRRVRGDSPVEVEMKPEVIGQKRSLLDPFPYAPLRGLYSRMRQTVPEGLRRHRSFKYRGRHTDDYFDPLRSVIDRDAK